MHICVSVRHRNLGQNFLTGTVSSALGGLSKLTGMYVSRAMFGAVDRPRIRVSKTCVLVACAGCLARIMLWFAKCVHVLGARSAAAPFVVQVDVRQPTARNVAARSRQPHTAESPVSAAVRTSRPLHAVCRWSACSFIRALARSARLSADSRQCALVRRWAGLFPTTGCPARCLRCQR
jgi:hypothetical protein